MISFMLEHLKWSVKENLACRSRPCRQQGKRPEMRVLATRRRQPERCNLDKLFRTPNTSSSF
jgi:hypothetical protein